jgi:hypothetical protein
MITKTIKITRRRGGLVSYSEIGPNEPFHEEAVPPEDLIGRLRYSGMPEHDIEKTLARFAERGSANSSQ